MPEIFQTTLVGTEEIGLTWEPVIGKPQLPNNKITLEYELLIY